MDEEVNHRLDTPQRVESSAWSQAVASVSIAVSTWYQRLSAVAGQLNFQGISALALSLALILLFLLPLVRSLPFQLALGVWAPLPRFAVALTYRYDALSHLFTFFTAAACTSIFMLPNASRSVSSRGFLTILLAFLVALQSAAAVDLLVLYVGWEISAWLIWLLTRPFSRSKGLGSAAFLPVVTYLTGLGLLVAVIILAGDKGSALRPSSTPPGALPAAVLTLILVSAAARSSQFPFHHWFSGISRLAPPVNAALLFGIMAGGGPYLLARALQASGGTWPLGWSGAPLTYTLVAIFVSSLLAWRTASHQRAFMYAASADLGLVLAALIVGTPSTIASALLLMVSNGLSLAGFLIAVTLSQNGNGARPRPFLHLRRIAIALSAASVIGLPPLLGFTARWQLLAALWSDTSILPFLAVAIAAVPRSIALLRAVGSLVEESKNVGERTEQALPILSYCSALLPVAFLVVFSVIPWLPQRYLVDPAVLAITGLPHSLPYAAEADLRGPIAAGIALFGALVIAALSDHRTRQSLTHCGVLDLPSSITAVLGVVGTTCRLCATAFLTFGSRVLMGRSKQIGEAMPLPPHRVEALMETLEERYYLATMLLLGMVITLALIG